ncbi:MAG: queuosine salvage family protein [Candidatus Bipolaricaulis sp.]|nr:queuosine salvage family protein [Candidatus Bipolaricaulis sp.]
MAGTIGSDVSGSSNVFDRIRAGCRAVAEVSRSVWIDEEALVRCAESQSALLVAPPRYDEEAHFLGRPDDTVAYVVTLDAVNFGSGYFPHLAKRPGHSGYFTVAMALADRFRRRGPLTAGDLTRITAGECAELFGQSLRDAAVRELMGLFAHAWNDLGRDLTERFHGSFLQLVEAAGGSAEHLVEIVDAQPFFRDVATYNGRDVPFYKRAQILASDLALALRGEPWGRFRDLDRLTIFADNLVPHVLRIDGVLGFDSSLVARIEREELLDAGSREEVEIRACAVHAVERLVEELRARGRAVTARDLDLCLWTRGQAPRYKAHAHRHRTRCVFY